MSAAYFMKRFLEKRRRRDIRKILTTKKNLQIHDICSKDTNNFNAQCRICLKDANIPIFNQESPFNISEAIRIFGGVELHDGDDYSQYVCGTCHTFLKNAVLFRKSAQDTENLLRQASVNKLEDSDDFCYEDSDHSYAPILKPHDCRLCKASFETLDELHAHKNSKAHKSVRVQCPICLRLLTAHLYKRHLASHQSASHLICDICGKLYRKDNLVRHLQLHNFDLPYQCQVCPYRGRFMESLKIHMRIHTGDKPFSCDKCELRFLTRSNLNRHLLTHKKERPFKCVECGRGFYTKRDKDSHFKADHAGLKDFICRMCGNKYGTRKALMRHELRVHKRVKMAKGRVPLYLQAEYQKDE